MALGMGQAQISVGFHLPERWRFYATILSIKKFRESYPLCCYCNQRKLHIFKEILSTDSGREGQGKFIDKGSGISAVLFRERK